MTSRLIDIRGPNAQEAEGGAWIVFHRRDRDGVTEYFIGASYYEGSYQQWGAPTPILGDNVEAVTQWANGLREVEDMVRDDDEDDDDGYDPDEDDEEAALSERGLTPEGFDAAMIGHTAFIIEYGGADTAMIRKTGETVFYATLEAARMEPGYRNAVIMEVETTPDERGFYKVVKVHARR